ncbi:MAG: cytochrome b/b6 domain-containing protein [Nitrososphaerota archaeon]|nr:cytochrome b/b6 domain-containing protein [Nitrososphaerota archaeon]
MLPLRLPTDYAAATVLFFVAIFAVHYVRRAFREPHPVGARAAIEIPEGPVKAFDIVQRLFHWSLFVTLGLVTLTGINIYYTGALNFFLAPFGVADVISSMYWHTTLLWLLLSILIIHMAWDVAVARSTGQILPKGRDVKQTFTRLLNFFGATNDYPKHGKYDVFMKTAHWGMALCMVVLGISGLYMWNPYGYFPTISPDFNSLLTIFHDFFAFLFVGLIIGHVYFAVLPVNWPMLRSIVTGTVAREEYLDEFDTSMWPAVRGKAGKAPPAAMAVAPKEVQQP